MDGVIDTQTLVQYTYTGVDTQTLMETYRHRCKNTYTVVDTQILM